MSFNRKESKPTAVGMWQPFMIVVDGYSSGKHRIEQAARHHLELDGSRAVLLMVVDF
jgi:hypothetical protein